MCGPQEGIITSGFCKKFLLKIRFPNSPSLGTLLLPAWWEGVFSNYKEAVWAEKMIM